MAAAVEGERGEGRGEEDRAEKKGRWERGDGASEEEVSVGESGGEIARAIDGI